MSVTALKWLMSSEQGGDIMSSILIFCSHQRCGYDVLEAETILRGWPLMDGPTSCVGVMGYTIYLFQVEGRWLFDLLTQLELPRTVRPG